MKHAMQMRHIFSCGLSGYITFSTLSHKVHDLKKPLNAILCNTCLKLLFVLRRTERDVMKMYIGPRVNYPLFISDFNET